MQSLAIRHMVRQESLSNFKEYLSQCYEAYDGVADLYAYFMEKSVSLLRVEGRFSFIVSSSFLRTTYGKPLRGMLKTHAAVLRILDFGGLPVFEDFGQRQWPPVVFRSGEERSKPKAMDVVSHSWSLDILDHDTTRMSMVSPFSTNAYHQTWTIQV